MCSWIQHLIIRYTMDLIIFLEELEETGRKGNVYTNLKNVSQYQKPRKYGKSWVIESKKHGILNCWVHYDLVADH